jgi:thiol-disulfide isomerase/thioredoxin
MMLSTFAAFSLMLAPRLGIGDPAPALGYGAVLKGSPIRSFSQTQVTVVEFWATWCKPCIEFMPHLSELSKKYEDRADFISVSVMENEPTQLGMFVAQMGDKMAYPVVADKVDAKGQGFMHSKWLKAAQQDAIPVAFIVDKQNRIAWIGHPTAMEEVLVRVIEGTWDTGAFRRKFDAELLDETSSNKLIREGFSRLMATPRTRGYAETISWIDRNKANYEGPDTLAALEICRTLFEDFQNGDFKSALELAERDPTNGFVWTYLRPMLLVAKIDALQQLKRDWRSVANQVVEGPPDPNILMNLTDALALPDSKLGETDANIALKAAVKLAGLARSPMFLLRLAWAYHKNGQVDEAKSTIEEAISGMVEEKRRNPASYERTLARLKEAKAHFAKPRSS